MAKYKKSNLSAGKSQRTGKPATSTSFQSNSLLKFINTLNQQNLLVKLLPILLFCLAVLVIWLKPKIESDLYMTLAGGRDAFNGMLGKPDDWSFTTQGRTWINQNWGTGVLFFLAHRLFGFEIFTVIKALLVGLTAVLMIGASRKRGAATGIAMIVMAAALIFSGFFYSIRGSLFTFCFIPLVLWILYSSRRNPKLIYITAVITGIWANMHGGYIFGLLMMALWAGVMILQRLLSGGWKSVGEYWHFAVGGLAALLLTVFCNPFGIENLKMSLIMAGNTQFQNITEWQPVWRYRLILNIYTFFITLAIPFGLLLLRLIYAHKAAKTNKMNRTKKESLVAAIVKNHPNIGVVVFEILFVTISTILAVKSQRVYPIALLAAVPLVSLLVSWFIRNFRIYWLQVILCIVIFGFAGAEIVGFYDAYRANHPLWENGSLYKKMSMVYENNYPVAMAEFINDNQIGGNAFSCWTWDGYLRWYSPQIKVFIGGRAQQIHDEETLQKSLDFESGRLPISDLSKENVQIVLGTVINNNYQRIFGEFIQTANWVVVYFDGANYLAVDSNWLPARDIVERAMNNRLVFRDKATENISLVCASISLTKGINPAVLFDRMTAAVKYRYESWCYEMLGKLMNNGPNDIKVVNFLESELNRMKGIDAYHTSRGVNILTCQGTIAAILSNYYLRQGNSERSQLLADLRDNSLKIIEAFYRKDRKTVLK